MKFINEPVPPKVVFSADGLARMFAFVDEAVGEVGWFAKADIKDDGSVFISTPLDPVPHNEAHGATCDFNDCGVQGKICKTIDAYADVKISEEMATAGIDPNNMTATQKSQKIDRLCEILSEENVKYRVWCHSHVNMGTSPSGQDESMANHAVSQNTGNGMFVRLILNRRREIGVTVYDSAKNVKFENLPWSIETCEPVVSRAESLRAAVQTIAGDIGIDKCVDIIKTTDTKNFESMVTFHRQSVKQIIIDAVGATGHVNAKPMYLSNTNAAGDISISDYYSDKAYDQYRKDRNDEIDRFKKDVKAVDVKTEQCPAPNIPDYIMERMSRAQIDFCAKMFECIFTVEV